MPEGGKEPGFPWFPTDYIFACIDNREEAARAVQDLRGAGFHAEDVYLVGGQEATTRIEIACEHCNLVLRALRFLWKFMSDEGLLLQDYATEARAGHSILAVHVTEPDRVEEVRRILAKHHARRMEYWSHNAVITELAP